MAMKITLYQAKVRLHESEMTISKRDGEYRVNYKNSGEATAYYTPDLDDAVLTGEEMSRSCSVNYFAVIIQEEGGLSRSNYTRAELLLSARRDAEQFSRSGKLTREIRKLREFTKTHARAILNAKIGDEIQLNCATYVFCLKGPKPKEVH